MGMSNLRNLNHEQSFNRIKGYPLQIPYCVNLVMILFNKIVLNKGIDKMDKNGIPWISRQTHSPFSQV